MNTTTQTALAHWTMRDEAKAALAQAGIESVQVDAGRDTKRATVTIRAFASDRIIAEKACDVLFNTFGPHRVKAEVAHGIDGWRAILTKRVV